MSRIIIGGKALQFGGKTISMPPVYDDWFLPVQSALSTMNTQLYNHGLGNFVNGYYWASNEGNPSNGTVVSIFGGSGTSQPKENVYHVRPMRHFIAPESSYSLRDTGPGGGLVFFILETDYYEAWIEDLDDSAWSNITNVAVNTSGGTSIGGGEQNTIDIINQPEHITSAAYLCTQLTTYGSI